jgi:hypothetical protein
MKQLKKQNSNTSIGTIESYACLCTCLCDCSDCSKTCCNSNMADVFSGVYIGQSNASINSSGNNNSAYSKGQK